MSNQNATVLERFLEYIALDTQSVDHAAGIPSSKKQFELANLLTSELTAMGATDARVDEHCYVYATIPATVDAARAKVIPTIGFIAHMDTAPSASGADIKARVEHAYDGGDIILNKELGIVLSRDEYPDILRYIGQDIVVTDGTTLLGADDKAGIAEILTMASTLLSHPEIEHGTIRIGITPDEEVGRGADLFDVDGFGADFAYTIDGGELGEIEYENFNAANARLTVHGVNIHPGSAKGKMRNALTMAMEFHAMLPTFENPAYTEHYEGFYHLDEFSGNVESAKAFYIIRDHDRAKFEEKKEFFGTIIRYLNEKYGEGTFVAEVKDSYYNMREQIEPHMHLIDTAEQAMRSIEVEPKIIPIRGGTDGARLSFMGLPCPNLCTGGHNFHGRFEYIPVQSMEKIVDLLLQIVDIYAIKQID